MVWKQKTKCGIRTGGTIRSPFSQRRHYRAHFKRDPNIIAEREGVIIKTFLVDDWQLSSNPDICKVGLEDYGIQDGFATKVSHLFLMPTCISHISRGHEVFHPTFHMQSVQFSLGKRKRWLLPAMAQDFIKHKVLENDTFSPVEMTKDRENQDTRVNVYGSQNRWRRETPNVLIVERHVHPSWSLHRPCTTSVFEAKNGVISMRTPKNKYGFVGDLYDKNNFYASLKPSSSTDGDENWGDFESILPITHVKGLGISYEVNYPIATNQSPHYWKHCRNYVYDARHGYYNVSQVYDPPCSTRKYNIKSIKKRFCSLERIVGDVEELEEDYLKPRIQSATHSHVSVVDRQTFAAMRNTDTSYKEGRAMQFDLGEYLDSQLASRKVKASVSRNTKAATKPPKTYGKGCAVFIDREPKLQEQALDEGLTLNHLDEIPPQEETKISQIYLEGESNVGKATIKVDIPKSDLEYAALEKNWGDLHSEGKSWPRKFSIKASTLLPTDQELERSVDIINVLFKPDPLSNIHCQPTTVSVVVGSLDSDMKIPAASYKEAWQSFENEIKQKTKGSSGLSVKDIVDSAAGCMAKLHICEQDAPPDTSTSKHAHLELHKPISSLGILNDMFGWKTTSFSLQEAHAQLLDINRRKSTSLPCRPGMICNAGLPAQECGICYEELNDGNTTLTTCGHTFCNNCWQHFLIAQICDSKGPIQCPGHKCNEDVDDVTVMSLVPSWHCRHLSRMLNRTIETSPEWKWCPADSCKRAVMAITSNNDLGMTGKVADDPVQVRCSCGAMWCFECHAAEHWPAPCHKAKKFAQLAGESERVHLGVKKGTPILSVEIRHCPNCKYPIEKGYGCILMHCILCKTDFCWECLVALDDHIHRVCKPKQNITVELVPTGLQKSKRSQKYFKIALINKRKRLPEAMVLKEKRLAKLEAMSNKTGNYSGKSSGLCRVSKTRSEVAKVVREAFEFEYQAHMAIEWLAKVIAISDVNHRGLKIAISQLQFITDRITRLCNTRLGLHRRESTLSRLAEIVEIGKACVRSLASTPKKRGLGRKKY